MTVNEMKNEIYTLNSMINAERKMRLDYIINKLFEHPIAQIDEQYDFLKEIEKDLREYRKDFL